MAVSRERFGLPIRVFLYTTDQISLMLAIDEVTLKRSYLHYSGRSVGVRPYDRMEARNLSPDGEKPDWRVAEPEFIRWLKYKGFRVYDRTLLAR